MQPITPPPDDAPTTVPDGAPAVRRIWLAAVAGVLAVATLLAGELVRLPYYILSPGNATAVGPLVKVDGAPSFHHTGQVGGPSAGLAFTLALIDDLYAGDLTGGRKVAVTGTIDDQGRVGPVGGAGQKAVTARRAGAVAFLVPPDEERDAKKHAGSMRIITVRTLDDALAALQHLGGSELALPTTTTTTRGH